MSTTETQVDLEADDSGGDHSLHRRGFDREISISGVVWSGVVLTVVTVFCFLICWWGLLFMESLDKKHEPRLTAIQEEVPQGEKPLPALQVSPQDDLRLMRAEEEAGQTHPAWVDERNGKVRLPIDVALETVLQRGVNPLGAMPVQPAAPESATSAADPAATTAPATPAPPPASPGGRP